MENFYIKDIKITCCNLESSSEVAISQVKSGNTNYICVTDAGNLVNAHRKSPELKEAINNSFISLPDGRPISMLAKLKGVKDIERVAGPDFMEELFRKTSGTEIKHFFLGDTDEILKSLTEKISGKYNLKIAGTYSPEFGKANESSDNEIVRRINDSGTDIIWVSLGGGKQEIWMKNNYLKLNKGLMIGVGAAFRFFTGDIKRAPVIFQELGFEWFFRLIQQPGRMLKRYSSTLPFFLIYSAEEFFKTNSKQT
ncbi:MAG: WecB/TagA/CpsF family glycosyltransferase [Ignavibacteria bacterium]|nr:WecB/TagA/CpsF family glycosyltransferase [Ignavibacteria bacterium]